MIRRQPTKDGKSLKGDIAVEDVRDGLALFRTTAGAGGRRVVVIVMRRTTSTGRAPMLS